MCGEDVKGSRRQQTKSVTHVYDEILHRKRPSEKRDVVAELVFVLLVLKQKTVNNYSTVTPALHR